MRNSSGAIPLTDHEWWCRWGGRLTTPLALSSDDAVSRRHAVFERSTFGWSVRDTGSSNGTFVNGHRLQAAHSLSPGDKVVGGTAITFHQSPTSQAPADSGRAAAAAPHWVTSTPVRSGPRPQAPAWQPSLLRSCLLFTAPPLHLFGTVIGPSAATG